MLFISEIKKSTPTDERSPLETATFMTLEKCNIPFERVDNDPVESMEECIEINQALGGEIRKTIFLANQSNDQFYLLIMPAEKPFKTSDFCKKANLPRVSFADPEDMEKYLGTKPGSASIMGLINDKDQRVKLFMDKELTKSEFFCCNCGINTSHIKIKTKDLVFKFLPHIKHNPVILDLNS